jgi:hypothetical protein
MNAILFVIEKPSDHDMAGKRTYQLVLDSLRAVEPKGEQGEMLGENCWLLKMPHGVRALGHAIVESDKAHVPYRMLILQDEDLEWIEPAPRS